jgi:hypothetical protein
MSVVDAIGTLPAGVAARLGLYPAVPGVELRPLPAAPPARLDETEILAGARRLVPPLAIRELNRLAELTPRIPWVDGVAWLDFEMVEFYGSGHPPFAAVGTFHVDPGSPAALRLTLADAPDGAGILVTVRAQGIAVGPNLPGYFVVEGPGVDSAFADSGTPTVFTFFVPPGGTGPLEFRITTEPDRIRLWAFLDCTISQV